MTPSPAAVDDYVFLLGRPPFRELATFMRSMAVDGRNLDEGALTQEWRAAHAHLRSIEAAESGIADNVVTQPIPAAMQPFADRVLADPVFKLTFPAVPTDIRLVELDRLVVFQKFINLGFVSTIKSTLPAVPTDEDVARLAFGLDRQSPPAQCHIAQEGYAFVSPSTDFRFLRAGLVDSSKVSDFPTAGRPFVFLVAAVGFGANYLTVTSIDGRLVLSNGSHRAYALRELGVTRAPCVFVSLAHRDEIELVDNGELLKNPDRYLKTPRPALLKDYFDPLLTKVVPVGRKNRLVQVQVGYSAGDTPA